MTNAMNYKGYVARLEYDDEDGLFVGRVINTPDGIHFHGATVEELRRAFHQAVDGYLEVCERVGKRPEKPYSGQIMVRIDPAVHASAALAAELSGKSLNKWTEEKLRAAAEQDIHEPG